MGTDCKRPIRYVTSTAWNSSPIGEYRRSSVVNEKNHINPRESLVGCILHHPVARTVLPDSVEFVALIILIIG